MHFDLSYWYSMDSFEINVADDVMDGPKNRKIYTKKLFQMRIFYHTECYLGALYL